MNNNATDDLQQATPAKLLPSSPYHSQIPVMTYSTLQENARLAALVKLPIANTPPVKIVARSTFNRNFRNVVDLLDYAKRLNEDALVDLRIRRTKVVKKVVIVKEESAAAVTNKGHRTIKEDLQARFAKLREDSELYSQLERKVAKLTEKTRPNQELVIRNVGVVGKGDKDRIKVVVLGRLR